MIVFSIYPDAHRFCGLTPTADDVEVWSTMSELSTEPDFDPQTWRTFELKRDETDYADVASSQLPIGNACTFSSGLILTRDALLDLSRLLQGHGVALPISSRDGDFVVYHVTELIDALDGSKTECSRDRSGHIYLIKKFAFDTQKISSPIFRLAECPTRVFVTDEFVAEFERKGLTGITFDRTWADSDADLRAKFLQKRKQRKKKG